MVIYEAARALVNLKNVETRDLCPAISGKRVFFGGGGFLASSTMDCTFHVEFQSRLVWQSPLGI